MCLFKGEEIRSGGVCRCSPLCWWLGRVSCLAGGVRGTQTRLCESRACLLSSRPLVVQLQHVVFPAILPSCKLNTEHFCFTRKLHPDDFVGEAVGKENSIFTGFILKKTPHQKPKEKNLCLFRRSNARTYFFFFNPSRNCFRKHALLAKVESSVWRPRAWQRGQARDMQVGDPVPRENRRI